MILALVARVLDAACDLRLLLAMTLAAARAAWRGEDVRW